MLKKGGIILDNYKAVSFVLMENRTAENKDKEEASQFTVVAGVYIWYRWTHLTAQSYPPVLH